MNRRESSRRNLDKDVGVMFWAMILGAAGLFAFGAPGALLGALVGAVIGWRYA